MPYTVLELRHGLKKAKHAKHTFNVKLARDTYSTSSYTVHDS